MAYTDIGYDQFLSKIDVAPPVGSSGVDQLSAYSWANNSSASNIQGGNLISASGNLNLDLSNNTFNISDGNQSRVQLGNLPDGSVGLIVRDAGGNTLMQISGNTNIIQSSNGNIILDFTNQQLIIKDEGGTPRVLLGKF